jgi:carbonic anhydrase
MALAKGVVMEAILRGVQKFRTIVFPRKRLIYERLAEKQVPLALFITCGDSRIDPTLLTGTEPGEMFVERTPGNIVPIYEDDVSVGVSASIEYAVAVLGVKDIIVCGHSACGAMKALLHPEELANLPATARWLKFAQPAMEKLQREGVNGAEQVKRLTQMNLLEQISNLHTHPVVEQRFKSGTLAAYAWYYEIHTGVVEAYDSMTDTFKVI